MAEAVDDHQRGSPCSSIAEDLVRTAVVLDGQRGAPLADGSNLVPKARRAPPALFAHEPVAQGVDNGFSQAFPCRVSQLASESVRFRVFDAERHISVYTSVLILYHVRTKSSAAESARDGNGARPCASHAQVVSEPVLAAILGRRTQVLKPPLEWAPEWSGGRMKWSWKIGEFAGIGVYMHATFLLLLGWVAFVHWQDGQNLGAVVSGLAFILALFVCVVAHEYGHALTARRYGIKTRDITLLPIGGVARLERMPDDPRQELWVALAGPAVNVVIAGALFAWLRRDGRPRAPRSDGGRARIVPRTADDRQRLPGGVQHAARRSRWTAAACCGPSSRSRMEYTRATHMAANVGQGMAFLFGFAGLFGNPMLLFIAFFVWIGAAQESSAVQMKSALGGIPVGPRHADRLPHAAARRLAGPRRRNSSSPAPSTTSPSSRTAASPAC